MATRKLYNEDILALLGLANSKLWRIGYNLRDLRRLFHLMLPRERNLLKLVHLRGVSQRELAGLLGVCPRTVRRALRKARSRLLDPVNLALIARWKRLEPAEQRLFHLHHLHGVSLPRLARLGLVPAPAGKGRPGGTATLSDLRTLDRRLTRRARRANRHRQGRQSEGSVGAAGAAASTG